MMANDVSLIPRIQNAIASEKTTLQQLNVERNEVLRVLCRARFVDACDIHRIEAQYAAKIDNTSNDIRMMEHHVQELMGNA